jgi:hypothetical protein
MDSMASMLSCSTEPRRTFSLMCPSSLFAWIVHERQKQAEWKGVPRYTTTLVKPRHGC